MKSRSGESPKEEKCVPAFRDNTHAESNDVVPAGALAGNCGFHRRVESAVDDRKRGPGLTVCVRSEPVLAGEHSNVLFGRARAAGE